MTFANEKQRSEVLKNKRKLRDIEEHKTVFIEPDRSRHERIQEANMRRIVKSIPNLQFRGDRVVEKPE